MNFTEEYREKHQHKLVFYAIRHRPTGRYLLQLPNGYRRGYTFSEPEQPSVHAPIRLHPSEQSARQTLKAWARGKWFNKAAWEDSGPDIEIRPVPTRNIEDMEVVPVTLSF